MKFLLGKIEGYILAWKEDDHHPTLPSKEKSLPLGLVNFQFKLVDKYSSFAGATFSYVWNYGDGTIVEGTTNTTHEYQKLGNIKVVLGVNANKNGNTYHSLIYKNISIRGQYFLLCNIQISCSSYTHLLSFRQIAGLPNVNFV